MYPQPPKNVLEARGLKPSVAEVQFRFQALIFLRGIYSKDQRPVPFGNRTFRCCLLRGSTPDAALLSVCTVCCSVSLSLNQQAGRQVAPRECASPGCFGGKTVD
jgi:hypothetical protein